VFGTKLGLELPVPAAVVVSVGVATRVVPGTTTTPPFEVTVDAARIEVAAAADSVMVPVQ
jgi:hypothetical protein